MSDNRNAPFPGVVPHHCPVTGDHSVAFHQATIVEGKHASTYFEESGISALARESGGLCTFHMGEDLAIYQITNRPLVDDDDLLPTTLAAGELFGDFMGSLPNDHPLRPAKRAAIERSLGNGRFIDSIVPDVRIHAREYLERAAGRELPVNEFAIGMVAYVDSLVPGILDLSQRPINEYLASPVFGKVLRGFFEIASEVISKVNPDAMREIDVILPFVRDLLLSNFESLLAAPESNMIRRYFTMWESEFTRQAVNDLEDGRLKELGTVIVATYDTTAMALTWMINFLEASPKHKAEVVTAAGAADEDDSLGTIDLAVLEGVRLSGGNPTALWRRTRRPVDVAVGERTVSVPEGMMMWLDRRQGNQDSGVFTNPGEFDPENIRGILQSGRESLSSVLSRNRYEINSFSMVNTARNPRKCPGRLFAVRMQSVILDELYAGYEVSVNGSDLTLRRHSSMPRPAKPGTITITPKARRGEGELD